MNTAARTCVKTQRRFASSGCGSGERLFSYRPDDVNGTHCEHSTLAARACESVRECLNACDEFGADASAPARDHQLANPRHCRCDQ
eukprot:6191160-Pleurochrysis_carterae.AAC.1